MKALAVTCAVLALSLAACEQKPKPEEHTTTTGAAAPAEPVVPTDKAGTPAADTVAAKEVEDTDDIPTPADFEEEAEQKITATNLEQELATLEKEIGKK